MSSSYRLIYATIEHRGEHVPILNGIQWGNRTYASPEEALHRAKTAAHARAKVILKRDKHAAVQVNHADRGGNDASYYTL